jgi:hypothetical protein
MDRRTRPRRPTAAPLLRCSAGPLDRCSVAPLDRCSAAPLLRWTAAPLLRWTAARLWLPAPPPRTPWSQGSRRCVRSTAAADVLGTHWAGRAWPLAEVAGARPPLRFSCSVPLNGCRLPRTAQDWLVAAASDAAALTCTFSTPWLPTPQPTSPWPTALPPTSGGSWPASPWCPGARCPSAGSPVPERGRTVVHGEVGRAHSTSCGLWPTRRKHA